MIELGDHSFHRLPVLNWRLTRYVQMCRLFCLKWNCPQSSYPVYVRLAPISGLSSQLNNVRDLRMPRRDIGPSSPIQKSYATKPKPNGPKLQKLQKVHRGQMSYPPCLPHPRTAGANIHYNLFSETPRQIPPGCSAPTTTKYSRLPSVTVQV